MYVISRAFYADLTQIYQFTGGQNLRNSAYPRKMPIPVNS